jgi:hypothetical protein
LFLAALVVAAGFSSLLAEGNWPQFRGPEGNGHAKATGLPLKWTESENIAWKVAIPGSGHSSPVIFGNQIWLTTAIINPLSKEEQKQRLAKEPNPVGLEIAGGISLRAICVDRSTGEIVKNILAGTTPEQYRETLRKRGMIVGGKAEVVEACAKYAALGMQEIQFQHFNFADDTVPEFLAGEVAPAVAGM